MGFNAESEVKNITRFIRDYFAAHKVSGAVVGLSGGKDSAVVLALLARALGKENVVAVTMPCHSGSEDKTLAEMVARHFGVQTKNADLSGVFDKFSAAAKLASGCKQQSYNNSDVNLKPRLRTAMLYYFAAALSLERNAPFIVAGTSNKCELFVGYFTKGGDNVCDISVLADFSVSEVIKLGEVLGVPEQVLYRAPSDGISGVTDEENLKVTYSEIEEYMNDPSSVSQEARQRIEFLHNSCQHKFEVPTYRRGL